MLHCGIVLQLKAKSVAGIQYSNLGRARFVEAAQVAAEVVTGLQELLGGHDAVAVFADVLERRKNQSSQNVSNTLYLREVPTSKSPESFPPTMTLEKR
jgi:hypothetical protein